MDSISIKSEKDQIIIKINKNEMNDTNLKKMMDYLRLEYLISKADFDESLFDLGEKVKADWWESNKEKLLSETDK